MISASLHHPFPAHRYLPYLSTSDVRALPKQHAAAILSVGSVEQHGPHLPLITDSLVGQTLLGRALSVLPDTVQAWALPPLTYGKSNEHRDYPGTITLSAETLAAVLSDIAHSLARAGFRRLVLLNSHGGNPPILDYMARDLHQQTGLMLFSFSVFRMGVQRDVLNDQERIWGMHSGDSETSTMLALAPELVHMDRTSHLGEYPVPADDFEHISVAGPVGFAWLTNDLSATGVLGDPRSATAEKGQAAVDATVSKLAGVLEEICRFEMPQRANELSSRNGQIVR